METSGARGVRSLLLGILGPFPRPLAEEIARRLSARLPVPCRIEESPDDPPAPLLPGRRQADANLLLARLEGRPLADGEFLVGITGQDIAVPIFTFVFGLARLHGRAALVSVARLGESFGAPGEPDPTPRRALAEVLHELGHAAGRSHCPRYDCLMHFAATVEAIDLRGGSFCAECLAALPEGLRPRPE